MPVAAMVFGICFVPCGAAWAADGEHSAERPALTVVELFTSQGCSLCPPADALIGELAGREDILPLSEHVDYWDYLGWKDPFGSPAHSARQRDYARAFGLKYVYTPQIIVQGQVQVPGNEREAVLRTVALQQRTKQPFITVSWAGADQLVVGVDGAGVDGGGGPADVWLVVYDRTRSTRIERGENSGRALTNFNVVQSFRRIAGWRGEPLRVVINPEIEDWSSRGCAVMLQTEGNGPIVDAVFCRRPSG